MKSHRPWNSSGQRKRFRSPISCLNVGVVATVTVVATTVVGGCGGDDGGSVADAGDGVIDVSALTYRQCDSTTRIGGFTVNLEENFTATGGRVNDSVSPIGALETITEMGDCRRARALVPFCDPGCSGGQLCGLDSVCRPSPVAVSMGTVTVRGLEQTVTMEPLAPAFNYTNPGTLPHPGFALGDGIALETTGGDFAPLSFLGWGITPIAFTNPNVAVESGAALAISWTPMAESGPTEVHIELNVNLHGTSAGSRLECEVADTGSFSIPQALITDLMADGLSGFPTLTLTRASSDREDVSGGCIDFKVVTNTAVEVAIDGLESCSNDDDCDVSGETCQVDLTCG